jgi:tetratricopeptide (TPR) repeat protein
MDALELAEQGKLEQAISEFTKAIELCNHYASAYNNRAQTYRLMNLPGLAMKDIEKAIEFGSQQTLKQV